MTTHFFKPKNPIGHPGAWWHVEVNSRGVISRVAKHTNFQQINLALPDCFSWSEYFLIGVWEHFRDAALQEQARAFLETLQHQGKKNAALRKAAIALDTWTNIYAPEFCSLAAVRAARKRIDGIGTLAFIAETRQVIREALDTEDGEN